MSQTREKWNSIVWVELTFKGCEDAMIFCVLIFIFCLEPKVGEQLDESDFRHYYGFFFESAILKLFDHSYVQSYFATVRRLFCNGIWNNSLQLKILRTWISIGTTYFLSKFIETKIDERAWKIIYIIIRACSSKNIARRNFTYYCMLLFLSQRNQVFKFTIVLFR